MRTHGSKKMETYTMYEYDTALKYYIAGPMSGHPQFNIPIFDRVAQKLRCQGLDVTSPAELDSAEMRALAFASTTGDPADVESEGTWGDCLARDVKMITDELDAIVLLPQWYHSRGANLEAFVGLLCNKVFFIWTSNGLIPVSKYYMSRKIQGAMEVRHTSERED